MKAKAPIVTSALKDVKWLESYSHENMQAERKKIGGPGLDAREIFGVTPSRRSGNALLQYRM